MATACRWISHAADLTHPAVQSAFVALLWDGNGVSQGRMTACLSSLLGIKVSLSDDNFVRAFRYLTRSAENDRQFMMACKVENGIVPFIACFG
jgi:hypothetical protein